MLSVGTAVGPYQVLGPLGAGGMGEVYRAHDARLGRDVAIKVLRHRGHVDPDRQRRFELEARAAGSLNHPAIVAIHDAGMHDGAPYVVSELLVGETLRVRLLAGPLPARKALEFAAQIALGLAVAHEKGIVHRDLKPENLFLTQDGRVKILDFGLAKLDPPVGDPDGHTSPALAPETGAGIVMGTVGYMSPEQVQALPADHRSDIFSFGAVLYEMLCGRRAFHADTPAETMTAILRESPPPLALGASGLAAAEAIVERCLEKPREARFQSARDLAFALEALTGLSTRSGSFAGALGSPLRPARPRRLLAGLLIAALAALGAGAAYRLGRSSAPRPQPVFERLSYGRGVVTNARFAPDGRSVLYSAAWDGGPSRVYLKHAEDEDATAFDLPSAELLAVSATGELALLLHPQRTLPYSNSGTLALLPLTGGAPREVAIRARGADWSPDGARLAVIRDHEGRSRLELRELSLSGSSGEPPVKVLYETATGYLSRPRFSPAGDQIAFFDHRYREGMMAAVVVVDLKGASTTRAPFGWHLQALAWRGRTLLIARGDNSLRALDEQGEQRELLRTPHGMLPLDVAADGRLLLLDNEVRVSLVCRDPASDRERDMTWLGTTVGVDLSADGRRVLFTEFGSPKRNIGVVAGTDGSPLLRLGAGEPKAFSPDGRQVLSEVSTRPPRLALQPIGPGEATLLAPTTLHTLHAAQFTPVPQGTGVVFSGSEPDHGVRLYVQDLAGGTPRAVTSEGLYFSAFAVTPDGRAAAAIGPDRRISLYPLDGGAPTVVAGTELGDQPIRFDRDGALHVFRFGEVPAVVRRIDMKTGRSQPTRTLAPADRTGVVLCAPRLLTADARGYCYQFQRVLSKLYLATAID